MKNSDELKLVGVMEKGYGIIPKLVMKDKELSVEAKSIYAYFCSYAGAGNTAFPSVELICSDLNMSDKRFRRHREVLVEKGYLKIRRYRTENGFSKNVYTLPQEIVTVSGQNVPIQNVGVQNVSVQNDSTNNNSINNNSLNNNKKTTTTENSRLSSSEFQKLISMYEDIAPGSINKTISEHIGADLDEYGFELVEKAFEVAALQNKRFYSYISGILRNWKNEGVRSVADLEDKKKSAKRKVDNDPAVYKGVEYNFD